MVTTEVDVRAWATAVARYGLPGAEPPPPLDERVWPLALATLGEEKILGIATAAADAGWLPVTDDQYEGLVARQRDAMAWCLGLERRLLQIAEAFDAEGIDFIVLKGPALAHTVYPDPSWRTFNDLDLLVRTSQWGSACQVLADGLGWPRRLPEPRPGFDVRFGKAAVFTTETGQQIDLHRNLAQGPFGVWIRPDELFERRERLGVGGSIVPRPAPAAMFVHACVHAILGDASANLIQLRDVAQTRRAGLDEAWLDRVSNAWRIGAVIARATEASRRLDPAAAVAGRWTEEGGWALRVYERGSAGRVGMHVAMLRAIRGVEDKARYVRDLTVPKQDFARARGGRWRRPLAWVMSGSMRGRVG